MLRLPENTKVTYEVAQMIREFYIDTCIMSLHTLHKTHSYIPEALWGQNSEFTYGKGEITIPFKKFSARQLISLGFKNWTSNFFLLPRWMYDHIPLGYVVETFEGEELTITEEYKPIQYRGERAGDCPRLGVRLNSVNIPPDVSRKLYNIPNECTHLDCRNTGYKKVGEFYRRYCPQTAEYLAVWIKDLTEESMKSK